MEYPELPRKTAPREEGCAMRRDDLTPAIRLAYASRAAATTAAGFSSPNVSGEKPQAVAVRLFCRLVCPYGRAGREAARPAGAPPVC